MRGRIPIGYTTRISRHCWRAARSAPPVLRTDGRPRMIARRLFIVLVVAGVTGGLLTLLWHVLAPGGWTLAKLAMLVGALGTVPWTGLCLANGLLGFLVLLSMRPTTQEVTAPTPTPRIYRVNRRVDKLLRHPPFAAWRRWCWGQKPWVTQELTHPTAAGRSMDAASHVDLQ